MLAELTLKGRELAHCTQSDTMRIQKLCHTLVMRQEQSNLNGLKFPY